MKTMLIFLGLLIALQGCLRRTDSGNLIKEGSKITEIIVRLPGRHGGIEQDVIKKITDIGEISLLIAFVNQHTKDRTHWMDVDSALSPVALISLRFLEGREWKGTFGFSGNFGNNVVDKDPYGIGPTFFEVFDTQGHHKKNVALNDVEAILQLTGFSKDDYSSLQDSWVKGLQWKPKQ